jgi:hypothetical protein
MRRARIPKYKTEATALKYARLYARRHIYGGSRLIVKLPNGMFTHLPICVGSDNMAALMARACGAGIVDILRVWRID